MSAGWLFGMFEKANIIPSRGVFLLTIGRGVAKKAVAASGTKRRRWFTFFSNDMAM
jgi:hypothetical protein